MLPLALSETAHKQMNPVVFKCWFPPCWVSKSFFQKCQVTLQIPHMFFLHWTELLFSFRPAIAVSGFQTIFEEQKAPNHIIPLAKRLEERTSQMEDLDPDFVRDMNTLSSLITTKCTSFTGERSFFLDTSCKERARSLIYRAERA